MSLDKEIRITDTGAGIDLKDLPHVFDRFYKGNASASYKTGLGLSIVKEIIEQHKGRIEIESQIGKGTTVHIVFTEFLQS